MANHRGRRPEREAVDEKPQATKERRRERVLDDQSRCASSGSAAAPSNPFDSSRPARRVELRWPSGSMPANTEVPLANPMTLGTMWISSARGKLRGPPSQRRSPTAPT